MRSFWVLCGVISAVLGQTTPPSVAHLRQIFHKAFEDIDLNHDGFIEKSEWVHKYRLYDTNGDGRMSLSEYATATQLTQAQALTAFQYYDQDHSGTITEQDVDLLAMDFDLNHDGRVNEAEFITRFIQIVQKIPTVGK